MNKYSQFQKIVWDFYQKNKRDLPWRRTTDPYNIFISEVMLQQTQVSRVIQKYEEFIKKFPHFSSLARGRLAEILGIWQGLGYNRRALYLHKTAKIIHADFKDVFPREPKVLESFPGIGYATARSILVFSFNLPLVFIETNIRRVFIHHFFQDKEKVHDNEIFPLVERTLDVKNSREWYFALMDYGSHLGRTIVNPNKKSKHYIKQSQFEGSLRQVRGRIFKELSLMKKMKVDELKEKISFKNDMFEKALQQLNKEGFLTIKDNVIRVN